MKQKYDMMVGITKMNLLSICLTAILPIRDKQRATVGKAACPFNNKPTLGLMCALN